MKARNYGKNIRTRIESLEEKRPVTTFCPESTILCQLLGVKPGECVTIDRPHTEAEVLEGLDNGSK